MEKKLSVLQVSPEVVPFAKTGGLADVVGSLPVALRNLGHEVSVVMPLYREVKKSKRKINPLKIRLSISLGGARQEASIYQGNLSFPKKVPIYFIENESYFDRECLYGTPQGDYPDNAERFAFFSRAALEMVLALGLKPDVIHCHDWQSALLPLYHKLYYRASGNLSGTATLLTVHNLAYQGIFGPEALTTADVPQELFNSKGVEFYGKVNYLKAGLLYSDLINTVSHKYSQEIQTPEYGYGLDGVLRERSADLFGIINGVDYKDWDPATDKNISANYDAADLTGKKKCKRELLKEFGLTGLEDKPLLGMISRLAAQKGFDLLAEAADELLALDLGLIVLGTGDEKYQRLLSDMAQRYPAKMALRLAFDNRLAHKIEAGCDLFLMPSRYEPCGLNQIYSLKYGTIPLVRATGGLDDTVESFDPGTGKGNGFKFFSYDATELVEKVKEAIGIFLHDKANWRKLMQNAVTCDFSWEKSAERYVELYQKALSQAEAQ